MKINYDKEVDAAYIRLSEKKPRGVVEITEGVHLDLTENNELVGIEILQASKKFPLRSLFSYEYDENLNLNPVKPA